MRIVPPGGPKNLRAVNPAPFGRGSIQLSAYQLLGSGQIEIQLSAYQFTGGAGPLLTVPRRLGPGGPRPAA